MRKSRIAAGCAGLLFVVSASAAIGQTVPGARPGDKQMTCEDVTKEQAKINKEVQKSASRKAAGKKLGKSLFGFAKNIASATVPSAVGGLGGSSIVGAAVGRAASESVGSAIYRAGETPGGPAQTNEPKPTAEQQARLDRLTKVAAYRQCPAA